MVRGWHGGGGGGVEKNGDHKMVRGGGVKKELNKLITSCLYLSGSHCLWSVTTSCLYFNDSHSQMPTPEHSSGPPTNTLWPPTRQ